MRKLLRYAASHTGRRRHFGLNLLWTLHNFPFIILHYEPSQMESIFFFALAAVLPNGVQPLQTVSSDVRVSHGELRGRLGPISLVGSAH